MWFDKKTKSQQSELDLSNQYERKHSTDWQTNTCVICKRLLKIDLLGYDLLNSEISCDVFIRHEHKFLRNIKFLYTTKLLCSVSEIHQNLYKPFIVVSWFACNERRR